MKRIAVVTTTRAEYGLLNPVIKELRKYESDEFNVALIVSGTHLSDDFGLTVNEIIADNVRIDHRVEIPVNSDSPVDISNNMAEALNGFTRLFQQERFNAVLILGDRYEMLAVSIAAVNTRTPIFHMCGGDVSEGAIDDCIRHSITKMSYLHFPTNEDSYRRIIQLGEQPDRVFNYGSTSIDNIMHMELLSKKDAMASVDCSNDRFAVCTYHPVTLENNSIDEIMNSFFEAIQAFPGIVFIVTKSNADQGGKRINALLDEKEQSIDNLHVFSSLGVKRYLSLVKYSQFVLGNSSSGIVEVPALQVPTVNIGDRQKGRLRSESVIDCKDDTASIVSAIKTALSNEMRAICQNVVSPYGDGNAAKRIAEKCVETINGSIDLKKKFYDKKYNR